MSSRSRKLRGADRKKDQYASQGYPPFQMYPVMPSYPPPHWVAPNVFPNFQNPWYKPWTNQQQFHGNNSPWVPEQATKLAPQNIPDATNNEFMVNAVRRIYNNDDGSIEIERVKVQRRSAHYDTKLCSLDYPKNVNSSNSVVSDPAFEINERKPPPRKNRRSKEVSKSNLVQDRHGISPQSWYPYLPYISQMYPFPYPYSYLWPSPISASLDSHSHTDESDCSRHEGHPSSPESPRLKKLEPHDTPRVSSADHLRAASSAATSQVTGSHVTDIGPSDSISMRGYKRKSSLDAMLGNNRTSTISDQTTDSAEGEKTNEWMQEMKQIFVSAPGYQSDATGDRTSFVTATSEIPTPPLRCKGQSKINKRKKSNSESDIGLIEKLRGSKSPPILSSTRVSESDLTPRKSSKVIYGAAEDSDERRSRASTLSFHSTRQSSHEPVDTDSTDIALPTDTATADESTDHLESETPVPGHNEISYKWVLQETENASLSSHREESDEQEINLRDSWKAEVSLWRALLVVSLCNGQGLDQGDWNTFQLLVQHPLSISSKLSLLNARRLCSLNTDLGVVFLRNALLHLTTYGEMLLKKENERPPGWNIIRMDGSQIWAAVKGSLEILYVFGYRLREERILRYRPKCAPETSVISRMTLDILVLAEEFRLYLNGVTHNAMEVTQLFAPLCSSPETVHSLASNNAHLNIKPEEDDLTKNDELKDQNLPTEKNPSAANVSSVKDIEASREKVSGSSESLTPVGSLTTSKEDLDSAGSTKKHIRDNPEDHIYEEITDVKDKVESLREIEKITSEPPPLPPKSRIKLENFYPFVDLSIGSQCNSSCGSTSSKTKKRRAPMPPSFMASKDYADEMVRSYEYQKELNPFYEKHEKASGYVGKNPFYEDVKLKDAANVKDSKVEAQNAAAVGGLQASIQPASTDQQALLQGSNYSKITQTHDTIALKDDEIIHTEPGIRPQRKKLQSRSNSSDNELTINQDKGELINGSLVGQQEDSSDSQTSSVVTVKNSDVVNFQYEDKSTTNTTMPIHKVITSKNVEWEQQCNSLVVVPNSNLEMERNNENEIDLHDAVISGSKQEKEKDNELQENTSEINIPPNNSEKDKEMESPHLSQNVIMAINKSEIRNDVGPQTVLQGPVDVENKPGTEKEKELQSAARKEADSSVKPEIEKDVETVIFSSQSGSEKDNEVQADFPEAVLPCIKPENKKNNGIQNNVKEAVAISGKSENEQQQDLQSDNKKSVIQINKSTDEKEMDHKSNVPAVASSNEIKHSILKTPYSKHSDVIIREIIISYDISLNGSEKKHTKGVEEKNKRSLELDNGKETTPCIGLHKKSILDEIEFIDAEEDETLDQSTETTDKGNKIDGDLSIRQSKDSIKLAEISSHVLQSFHPETVHTDKVLPKSVNISVPTPPDISPPPTPPLCSHLMSPSSSPSFVSHTTINRHPENDNTLANSLLARTEETLPSSVNRMSSGPSVRVQVLPIILPETPHTSPPSSPVVFLHNTTHIATLDHKNDSESCNKNGTDEINDNTKILMDNEEKPFKSNINNMSEESDKTAHKVTASDDDKENIMFKHENVGTRVPVAKNPRNDKTDKDTFEERYEIPDVLRAEENVKRMMKNLKRDNEAEALTIFTNQESEKLPERPPRHRHFRKVPPLPPKPPKQNIPPALPPKGVSSSVVEAKPAQTDSIPTNSQLNRTPEVKYDGNHSTSPSPLAIPSVSPQLYTAPAINELRQLNSRSIIRAQNNPSSGTHSLSFRGKPHKISESKSQQKYYVPTNSVSMPSSPKASLSRLKHDTKSEKDRKSWPFQLCNCLYSRDYAKEDQIKIKYVRE